MSLESPEIKLFCVINGDIEIDDTYVKNDRCKYAKIFNGHFSHYDVINPNSPGVFMIIELDLSFLMRPCLLKLDHSFLAQLRFSSEAGGIGRVRPSSYGIHTCSTENSSP